MFAKALKELRICRGTSQAALAKILGVRQQTVGKWETGLTVPRPPMLQKIAGIFDVSTDYLLGHCANNYVKEVPTPYTPDMADIPQALAAIIQKLDKATSAAEQTEAEDQQLLKSLLQQAIILAKRLDRKKATLSVSKEPTVTDTATLIGQKILNASPSAQAAVSDIIKADSKQKGK